MSAKLSNILKNMIFSLRLIISGDCAAVLLGRDASIAFQQYDNDRLKSILQQRLKLIEWSNLQSFSKAMSDKQIEKVTTRIGDHVVMYFFLGSHILVVVMTREAFLNDEVMPCVEKAKNEIERFCHDEIK